MAKMLSTAMQNGQGPADLSLNRTAYGSLSSGAS